jgi:hypothetical protein
MRKISQKIKEYFLDSEEGDVKAMPGKHTYFKF